jgi:hypothetical protein
VIVSVGQANPSVGGQSSFGSYSPGGPSNQRAYAGANAPTSGNGSAAAGTGANPWASEPYGEEYGGYGSNPTPGPAATDPNEYGYGDEPTDYGVGPNAEPYGPPTPGDPSYEDWPAGYDDYDLGEESYDDEFTE